MNRPPLSARDPARVLRPLREDDLPAVVDIERRAFSHPWTHGMFRDCLGARYSCWRLLQDEVLIGYGLLSLGADEAHVLNLCVEPGVQGRGHGRWLLRALLGVARTRRAQRVFLEVRASAANAIHLYASEGFNEIGRRPRYYPARNGREDAIVMALELLD